MGGSPYTGFSRLFRTPTYKTIPTKLSKSKRSSDVLRYWQIIKCLSLRTWNHPSSILTLKTFKLMTPSVPQTHIGASSLRTWIAPNGNPMEPGFSIEATVWSNQGHAVWCCKKEDDITQPLRLNVWLSIFPENSNTSSLAMKFHHLGPRPWSTKRLLQRTLQQLSLEGPQAEAFQLVGAWLAWTPLKSNYPE